jgi:hypothetical protein
MSHKNLLEAAILGLERHPLPPDVVKSEGADDTSALLRALARQYLLEKGASPLIDHKLTPPLPDHGIQHSPGVEASALLCRIMKAPQEVLLDEYLNLLAEQLLHIPAEALPEILDKALTDRDFAQKIKPLLGSRGEWLAAQVPKWAQLFSKTDPQQWPTASFAERIHILQHLRRENPAAAIPLLLATWHTESWQERQAFIQELKTGLSIQDEHFLEHCLDDKRKEIRKIAAQLLAGIPESSITRQLQQYARSWIQAGKAIVLPDTIPADALRNGLEYAGGNKASLVRYLFGQIDPVFWQTELSLSPEACLTQFLATDWAIPILEGLVQSIYSFSRHGWADELLLVLVRAPGLSIHVANGQWVKLLSKESLNRAVRETLNSSGGVLPEKSVVYQMLLLPGPELEESTLLECWSGFKWQINRSGGQNWSLFHYHLLWRHLALRTPRELLMTLREDFESHNQAEWGQWERDLQYYLDMLAFRQSVYQAFQP